ncbi:MAG: DUF4266 domain-containing protein [Proteobacteria bacterium]|nr:DUF4266 domain-containing protein [Pseudomonadota bacterium]
MRALAAALAATLVAGCATLAPPKPWEKGELAKPSMQFDYNANSQRYTEHVYDSKEKAGGGVGVGGGGCGCN